MSAQGPQNPRAWVIRPRARNTGTPPMLVIGKHYGRAIHHIVPCTIILDTAKTCLELRQANQAIEDPNQNTIFREYYLPLRHRFGQALDDELINDDDWSFRRNAASQFHKGRCQGRSDDLVCLRRVLPSHPLFRHLPVNHTPGFATNEYAALLRTPDLDLNNPEIRAALNAGLIDAPSNQLYAGVYANYEFPGNNAHPFEGLFRSALFVDMYLGVFYGPRASKHLSPGSGGRRSKAFKNDMIRVTKASIAYIAMLVRFCLHQNEDWYTVESNLDTRYNYFILYTEVLALLDEPTFKTQVDDLLAYLNRIPANPPSNNGPSSLELALAQANALAGANH